MQPAVARIHRGLSALVLAGLLLDVYLVGAGMFGATSFEPPRMLGFILAIAIMLVLLLALLSRPSRRVVGLSALLATLTVLQVALPSLRTGVPLVAALHAINALALLTVTAAIVRTPGAADGTPAAATR